jgi:hypothetical protein
MSEAEASHTKCGLRFPSQYRWVANSRPDRFTHGQQTIEQEAGWAPETISTFWRRVRSLARNGIGTTAPAFPNAVTLSGTRLCQYCVGLGIWATRQISRETKILGNVCGVCTRVTKPRTLPSANKTHLSKQRSLGEQVFKTISAPAQPSACSDRLSATVFFLCLFSVPAKSTQPSTKFVARIWCSYPRQKGHQNLSLTASFHLVPRLRT